MNPVELNEPEWLTTALVLSANQWSDASVSCDGPLTFSACDMMGEVTLIINVGSCKPAVHLNASLH